MYSLLGHMPPLGPRHNLKFSMQQTHIAYVLQHVQQTEIKRYRRVILFK